MRVERTEKWLISGFRGSKEKSRKADRKRSDGYHVFKQDLFYIHE
jgi:hypothetical protein